MVLQNYKKIIEMTANMIYTVALGVGLKCKHKIHLNTHRGRDRKGPLSKEMKGDENNNSAKSNIIFKTGHSVLARLELFIIKNEPVP